MVEGVGVIGNFVVLEGGGGDLVDGAVLDDTVGDLSVGKVLGELHGDDSLVRGFSGGSEASIGAADAIIPHGCVGLALPGC